ncbi:MAG TPA: carboxypeptidase regulatory-like domain-containing protein [Candidatus Angelobacter sp.]|jgi:hypothetical protein|nr:carboxypeptidase regulatory-like domain-containing protein [Candidatus Angelobacter sp.]
MSPRSHLLLTSSFSNSSLRSSVRAQRNHHWARIALALAFCLVLLTIAVQPAWAQETTGTITGTVVDPNGAAIQGATVTAKDVDRGTSFTTQTNETGAFNLTRVPIGTYVVTVSSKGFETANYPKFTLELNQTARLPFQMKIGQVVDSVTVEGVAPLMHTDSAELGTVIGAQVLENTPNINGNYQKDAFFTAGVVSTNPAAANDNQTTFQVARPYINGNREQTNNYVLDGMDNNQNDNNDVAYSPNVDAIQEFNLITQNPSAEFGNFLGGILNASLKSGTDSYHGSVFEFIRNDVFNANQWSNNLAGNDAAGHEVIPRSKLRYNRFGGTFGGPIVKNKLFFFLDYQGTRAVVPSTQSAGVLSATERTGNLGELCTSTGATFNGAGLCSNPQLQLFKPGAGTAPGARTAIPFNNLTGAGLTLSPAAKAIVNSALYPLPNSGNNQLTYAQRQVTNQDQGDLKIDWQISSKDHVFGRYSQQDVEAPTTETYLLANNGITNFSYPLKNAVFDWTRNVTERIVNDARVGFNYFPINQGFSNPTGQNLPQTFGIPGSPSTFLPSLGGTFGNVATIANNLGASNVFADTAIQFSDSLIISHGTHEFHTGFQFNRYRDNFLYPGNEGLAGQFNFNGQYTSQAGVGGSGIADFLLGLPNSLGIGQGVGNRHVNNSYIATYFQDNWRATHNLTVNLGLRWDVTTARVAQDHNAVNYALFGGQVLTPANNGGLGAALYKTYSGIANFQPRIGLSWQPSFIKNTVVHAAWGISTFSESNGVNNLLTQNPPFETAHNVTFAGTTNLPGSTLDQGFGGFPSGCTLALAQAFSPVCFQGVNIHAFDPNLRPAVHQMWNLGIQHQFGNSTTVQLGYVGQTNQHLANIIMLQQRRLNPDGTTSPSPFLNPTLLSEVGQARFTLSNGIANYHALQAILQERLSRGLETQVSFTWSKCLSDTPGFFGQFGDNVPFEAQTIAGWAFPQNPYNQRADYGRCPQDLAANFNGYVTYDLPFGHGRQFSSSNNVVNSIIGGWRVSSSFTFHTGFAQTVFAPFDTSGSNGFSTRPNCVPGVPSTLPFQRVPGQNAFTFLNPAAVSLPAPGTFGNCPVGAFRGPGYKSADLSLAKAFSIAEKHNVEFRVDAINLTNTPIFGFGQEFSGQHTQGAPNYGQISGSQGARNLQFGLKYKF